MEYYDLGPYRRAITTASAEAQTWFDRGLNWCYGYNHGEAVSCFKRALEADADCAMAHWGVAYALGPNYNMQWHHFDPAGKAEALAGAYDATQKALSLAGSLSPMERALIEALPARYPQREPIDDQVPWNVDFANAMRMAWQTLPDDLEIGTIFSEAIMNVTPWQMWDLKTGGIAEGAGTAEVRAVLERAMADTPGAMDHPGILHLYVHLMEMSPHPELALKAGDRLREIAPDSGHLIHMPTHIDVLCGHYRDALVYNQKASAADRKFLEREGGMNFYTAYRIHNYHFAIYGAMFLGQYEPALVAAEELIETTPEALLKLPSPPMADFIESYISMKSHVYIRFGKWREIIAEPLPQDRELYCNTTAVMHYAKGVAHAALADVESAEKERTAFLQAKAKVPESRLLHNNTCQDLLAIAEEMLNGEIEYRKGHFDTAFEHLRRSVELDDALPYDEPWGWIQPARHALGALLFEQGRFEEAEEVYREDLGLCGTLSRATIHPDNVWSLRGLYDCLARKGETAEARLIKQRFDLAAARADVPVNASCFCARVAAE
ncbi:MAG: tetratricopeptide repeat protein [Pseudomonadota bacterium]